MPSFSFSNRPVPPPTLTKILGDRGGFWEGKGELFQKARFPLPNISLFQKFSNKNFLPLSMVSHVNILL